MTSHYPIAILKPGEVYHWPGTVDHCRLEGHIYVVGFEAVGFYAWGGRKNRVKVGMTSNPYQRVNYHLSTYARHGSTDPFVWVSAPHATNRENEAALLDWCTAQFDPFATRWPPCGGEFYDDLDPYAVVEQAMTLSYPTHRVRLARNGVTSEPECCRTKSRNTEPNWPADLRMSDRQIANLRRGAALAAAEDA